MDFNIVTICGHYLILLLLELKEGGGRKIEIEGVGAEYYTSRVGIILLFILMILLGYLKYIATNGP